MRVFLAFRRQFSDRIALIQRHWPSRPRAWRADPPWAWDHLPAAGTGATWFRPAYLAKGQTSGSLCVAENVNFYQLEETLSTAEASAAGARVFPVFPVFPVSDSVCPSGVIAPRRHRGWWITVSGKQNGLRRSPSFQFSAADWIHSSLAILRFLPGQGPATAWFFPAGPISVRPDRSPALAESSVPPAR